MLKTIIKNCMAAILFSAPAEGLALIYVLLLGPLPIATIKFMLCIIPIFGFLLYRIAKNIKNK